MPNETAIGIAAADDLSAVKAALRGFAGPFGYDHLVLFSASAARDEVIGQIDWVERDWFGDGESVYAETCIQRFPVNHVKPAAAEEMVRKEQADIRNRRARGQA